MINVEAFTAFLNETFEKSIIYFDRFKPEVLFFDIDCLKESDKYLTIVVSTDGIQVATVDKKTTLDFSPYDHYFDNEQAAKDYLIEVYKTGIYIPYK